MYSRSELRHACYRAKNNAATEKNKVVLEVVEPLLSDSQTWSGFGTKWDLMLDTNNNIKIIKPEVDSEFIKDTCLEIKMSIKNDMPLDDLSERQLNVKHIVESQMLDGIMTWQNYNKVWKVFVDKDVGMIGTSVIHEQPTQKPVTDEMIQGSMKPAKGIESIEKTTISMNEPTAMTPEEIAKFEAILEQMKNKKG